VNEKVQVPIDDAVNRLAVIPDYDPGDGPKPCVHTFAQSAIGMLGAHWSVDKAREFMEAHGVEEAGEMATAMHHSLVVIGDGRTIFFETQTEREDAT
jgi:hypothetical protein